MEALKTVIVGQKKPVVVHMRELYSTERPMVRQAAVPMADGKLKPVNRHQRRLLKFSGDAKRAIAAEK